MIWKFLSSPFSVVGLIVKGLSVLKFIETVEQMPDMTGEDKKKAVLQMVDTATDILESFGALTKEMNQSFDAMAPTLIDMVIALYNATGVLKHGTASGELAGNRS
jgi:hypothetical protein